VYRQVSETNFTPSFSTALNPFRVTNNLYSEFQLRAKFEHARRISYQLRGSSRSPAFSPAGREILRVCFGTDQLQLGLCLTTLVCP